MPDTGNYWMWVIGAVVLLAAGIGWSWWRHREERWRATDPRARRRAGTRLRDGLTRERFVPVAMLG